MKDLDKEKIYDLYFNELYSMSQIMEFFKNKYSYAEIRTIIMQKIK